MNAQWYVLHTKPRKENQVYAYLQSRQITTFYPRLSVKPVNPRSARERGFFPRYIFVRADLNEGESTALRWLPGAVGLVEFGGEPAPIPESFIHDIRRRLRQIEQAGGLNLVDIKQGDPVRILTGPFTGYDAIFDHQLSGEERVQVLLQWLGRQMKLKIDAGSVAKRRSG